MYGIKKILGTITGMLLGIVCYGGVDFPANAAGPIEIVAVLSKTGIAVDDNLPAIEAARLAVEELNSRGGVLGHPLHLTVLDNQSTPLRSKLAAQRAVEMKATAVIGAIWSSHSLQMAKILQAAEIPMITPASTKPEVTRAGDFIFRVCFVDSFQGGVMARFAFEEIGGRTAVVMTNVNEEYSMTLSEYFVKYFSQMGGRALYQGHYKGTAVDFTKPLTEAKASRPDVVFIPGYSRDSGLLIKQACKMGIDSTFLGCDAWNGPIYEYAGESLEGSYYSSHWHPQVPFEESRHLQKIYRNKYGDKAMTVTVPLTYDAVMLFADAAKRAKSLNRHAIRNALADTERLHGATGTITFDDNGDPLNKEAMIIQFEKGSEVFVKSVKP
jgi:branched-chain amino acid transport system substrate-binding protein